MGSIRLAQQKKSNGSNGGLRCTACNNAGLGVNSIIHAWPRLRWGGTPPSSRVVQSDFTIFFWLVLLLISLITSNQIKNDSGVVVVCHWNGVLCMFEI